MSNWERFRRFFLHSARVGISLDLSRMGLEESFLQSMEGRSARALAALRELEAGAIANPDENRQVGHYWLRKPELAPQPELRQAIENTLERIEEFAVRVHSAEVRPSTRPRFTQVLSIGIGGSALGPQFVSQALGSSVDRMALHFLDNTDPDGFDLVFEKLGDALAETLTVVISKSGSTPETLNGMLEASHAYRSRGLSMAEHAVAITGEGSVLDRQAVEENWLARFPMWDWVGGRTSVMSAVGLLPMALQGLEIRGFLHGAADMDEWTRGQTWEQNPALALALSWYSAGEGRGSKDMVILPYKDRLALFSRYLQQLVMESLGKEKDLAGNVVHQGLAVYGNKGSTDQHAYVQQLRDGLNNFFATFIVVLRDRQGESIEVAPGATSGDFLNGFWQGTRQALSENGRLNACITLPQVDAYNVGALIALYERAVSLYAQFIGINAYHQPGVEAGKKAAKGVLERQQQLLDQLRAQPEQWFSAEQLGLDAEANFLMMRHLLGSARVQGQGDGLELKIRWK